MNEGTGLPAQEARQGPIQVPWSVSDALLGVALVIVVGNLLTLGAVARLYGENGLEGNSPGLPLVLALPSAFIVLAVWMLAVRKYGARWRTLGLGRPGSWRSLLLPWLVLLASLTFGGVYGFVVTSAGLDLLIPTPLPAHLLGEGIYRLANFGIIGLAAPFAEEMFFRGFLLAALVHPMGALRAAVLSSAIFAASHFTVAIMIPVFVTSLLLSWLYLKTRSIWPPVTAHAAQNLLALSVAA